MNQVPQMSSDGRRMTSRKLVLLLMLSVAAGTAAFFLVPKPLPELSREELITEIRAGNVHEVVITDGELLTAVSTSRGRFRVTVRRGDSSLVRELSAMGVKVEFETGPGLIP